MLPGLIFINVWWAFETGASDFFAAGIGGGRDRGLGPGGRNERTVPYAEQVQDAEILEQFHDSGVWVEQFEARTASFVLDRAEFQAESRQDAQERAVHEHALGEVEHEVLAALLPEFVEQGLEVYARGKVGPPDDLHTGKVLADTDRHFG